jgi:hypothetical protein
VPVISILPVDDQTDILFFGNFLLRKSIKNVDEDSRAGILVITQQLQGWILKEDFRISAQGRLFRPRTYCANKKTLSIFKGLGNYSDSDVKL